jgi:hypothetical protein
LDFSFENFDDPAIITYVWSPLAPPEEINNIWPNLVNSSPLCGEYKRDAIEQYDSLIYSISSALGPSDPSMYVSGQHRFSMDVHTQAPTGTEILVQLEDSTVSSASNYPTGRHSRYRATTTVVNAWERLTFTLVDTPDTGTADIDINSIVILFATFSFTDDIFHFDNFDSYKASICGDGECGAGEDCDSCDSDCGVCPFICTNDQECDDGDPCNGDETCNASSSCVAGTALDCDDDDPCTADSCDMATGDCVSVYDNNVCPPVCGNGSCESGEDCNTCTEDCGTCSSCGGNRASCGSNGDCCSNNCFRERCRGGG